MAKTWIKVKRGLIKPKHIDAIGNSIWLFMYIIDVVDWDTGKINNWKDSDVAEELGLAVSTVRKYRYRLQEYGYILCRQKQYTQEITVQNWTDPRKYSGETINQGNTPVVPSEPKKSQGHTQGHTQGNTQVILDRSTPTYYSHITSHISQVGWESITNLYNLNGDVFFTMLTEGQQKQIPELLEKDADKCVKIAVYYFNMGERFTRVIGRILNNFDTWKTEDKKSNKPERKFVN